jgi:Flp pilus assembly protein TadB
MGTSAREIERQIKETRARMDDNLTRLERQASTRAKRYGKVAAVVVALAAVGGAAYLVYRRTRRPTLRDRLDDLSPDHLRTLIAEATERLRDRLPSVTVRFNEKTEEQPGTVESILREVAPALAGTAGTALLERVTRPPEE